MSKDIIIIALILLIFLIAIMSEHFGSVNMNDMQTNSVAANSLQIIPHQTLIEITNLTRVNNQFTINYSSNQNLIYNDYYSVYQPFIYTTQWISLNGIYYYLTEIELRQSKFSFNNQPVQLEISLIHTNYIKAETINIILILQLVKNNPNNILDINDVPMMGNYNKNNNIAYDSKLSPDSIYQCCGSTIGNNNKEINLNEIAMFINKTKQFYLIYEENNNTNYITPSFNFDSDVGNKIIKNTVNNPNIKYKLDNNTINEYDGPVNTCYKQ